MELIDESKPIARKDYVCDLCNRKIRKGQKYRRQFIRDDSGEYYYFVATTGLICKAESKKEELYTDNYRYSFFNQFRTEKQAQEAAKRVEETLEKYHNEIGE